MEDQTSVVCPQTSNKPRKRWRRRLLVASICLMIIFGAPAAFLYFQKLAAEAERDAIVAELDRTDPTWRTAHQKPQVTLNGNSLGEIVEAASNLIPPSLRRLELVDDLYADIPPFRLTEALRHALKMELERTRAALAKALTLADEASSDLEVTFSSGDAARGVSLLLSFAGASCAAESDFEAALTTIRAQLQVVRAASHGFGVIGFLNKTAVTGITLASLEKILGQGEVRADQVMRIQELLRDTAKEPTLREMFRSQRAQMHENLRNLCAGKFAVRTLVTSYGDPKKMTWRDDFIDYFPGPVVANTDAWYLRFFGEAIETSLQPPHAQRFRTLEEKWDNHQKTTPRLAQLLHSSFSSLYAQTNRTNQARLRCAIAGTAVESFRLQQKRWPTSLAEVVAASLLPEIPSDPMDGQPLRYRITDDGAIVYSIGEGGKNDGTWRDHERLVTEEDWVNPSRDWYEFRLWNPDRRGQPARMPSKLKIEKE